MEFSVDGSQLRLNITQGDTSLANAIRRAILNTSLCYAFPLELSPEDQEFFNSSFGTAFERKTFPVSVANFESIQNLSHRLSRLPIMFNEETTDLLESDLVFVVSDPTEYSKPYTHTEITPRKIYARDLTGLRKDVESGKWVELSIADKERLFPYNVYFTTLAKGDRIHLMARPSSNYGYEDSRFSPCPVRYWFPINSSLTGKDVPASIEEEQNWTPRDIFGNPEQISLIVEENGRKPPLEAVTDAITYLIRQLGAFQQEYSKETGSATVVKEWANGPTQVIKLFNGQIETDDGFADYLADFTIGNLIASHLLYRATDKIVEVAGDDLEKLTELTSHLKIAHIKPHPRPRVMEVQIHVQLPTDPDYLNAIQAGFTQEQAIKLLIDEVVEQLIGELSAGLEQASTLG